MTLTIESMRGMWRIQVDHRTELAETLEELLLKLAPDAPEEYVWHAAEVLGSILDAETVKIEPDYSALHAALFPLHEDDERAIALDPFAPTSRDEENWQPTQAQQAYFEDERTEDAEAFDPDTFPRGA